MTTYGYSADEALPPVCVASYDELPGWAKSRLCGLCLGRCSAEHGDLIIVSMEDNIALEPCAGCVAIASSIMESSGQMEEIVTSGVLRLDVRRPDLG